MKLKQKIYLILICLTIVTIKTIPILDSSYYVIYFDVGQGDSAALVSPFKKEVVLIDTGGIRNYNISDNTILYLKSIGVSKINTLIISHGDFDHCGDIFNINKKMKIKSIILNNNFVNDLEKSILNLNIKRIESVQLNYFNSVNLNLHTSQDENDSSLVFNFQINFINFLFTGDISIKYMENIIKENSLTTNVLKVAHHGSKYNTSNFIIESLKPSYAVISSGRGNWYNHPHEQTLQILNNENVKVFNTQEGSVIFKINKNSYKVFTENIWFW